MKKNMCKSIVLLLLSFCTLRVFAEKISIAPLLFYSEEGGKDISQNRLHFEFASLMQKYWFNGLVHFSVADSKTVQTVQTIQQAIAVCAAEKCDYLVYGYVRDDGSSLFGELRLFNPGNQIGENVSAVPSIEKRFFAASGRDEKDKLLDTLAEELYAYIADKYGVSREGKPVETKIFAVKIPFSAGYWTYTGENWMNLIISTAQVNTGIELFPKLDLKPVNNLKSNFSLRLEAGYRFGLNNPDRYPGYFHEITVALSVFYNLHFTENHGLSFGLAPLYSVSIAYMRPKYEETSYHLLNQMGCTIYSEYRYTLTPKIALTAGFSLDTYFTKESLPVFAVRLGILYTVYEKKEAQR